MKKVIAIIQARLSSTRLPRKVLLKIDGETILEKVFKNVSLSERVDRVVVATSIDKTDDDIYKLCISKDIDVFRGSLNNVLGRYYECAKFFSADTILRITSDCPLVSSITIDEAISVFLNNNFDYVSNTCPPEKSSYPDGSDVEVFSFDALKKSYLEKDLHTNNEHVTFQFWKNEVKYSSYLMKLDNDFSRYRYTLDYPEDFEVIKSIISEFAELEKTVTVSEIIGILDKNPEILKLNSKYKPGNGWK